LRKSRCGVAERWSATWIGASAPITVTLVSLGAPTAVRDPELLEHILAAERPHLVDRLALDHVGDHGCGRLADGTATAAEADVADDAVGHVQLDAQLVATERVDALGRRRGRIQMAVVPRIAVVIEDVLAVEVVHGVLHEV
jgi:hypothetical protein